MKMPLTLILTPLLLSTSLFSVNAVAADNTVHNHCSHDNSSHSHTATEPKPPAEPVNAEQAVVAASLRIADLVNTQAIDGSWSDVTAESVLQMQRKEDTSTETQWQVTFVNKAISQADRQTLYVFLGLDGSFRSTNYTGR